jgi:hypothetical protein
MNASFVVQFKIKYLEISTSSERTGHQTYLIGLSSHEHDSLPHSGLMFFR